LRLDREDVDNNDDGKRKSKESKPDKKSKAKKSKPPKGKRIALSADSHVFLHYQEHFAKVGTAKVFVFEDSFRQKDDPVLKKELMKL